MRLRIRQRYETLGKFIVGMDGLNRRCVDAAKVTDHHALLITGNKPIGLYRNERTVYDMIRGRMIEAFSDKAVVERTAVTAVCGDAEFSINGSVIRQKGWKAVYNEEAENVVLPSWQRGNTLHVSGCTLVSGKTKPKPLHTESSLLAAMETANLGTPATRAATIETLIKREYVVRAAKSLVPTEKGLALHSVVKGMDIANTELTGKWETELARIERGERHQASSWTA